MPLCIWNTLNEQIGVPQIAVYYDLDFRFLEFQISMEGKIDER